MKLKIGTSNVLNLGSSHNNLDLSHYVSINFENCIGLLKIESLINDSPSLTKNTSNDENSNIINKRAVQYQIVEIPFIVEGISRNIPLYTFPTISNAECIDFIRLKMNNSLHTIGCIGTTKELYLVLLNDHSYTVLNTLDCQFKTTNVLICENPFKGNEEKIHIYIAFSSSIELFLYEAIIYENNMSKTEMNFLKRFDLVVSCLSINNSKDSLYIASHNFNVYILNLMDYNLPYSYITVSEVVKSITHSNDDTYLVFGLWDGSYSIYYNKSRRIDIKSAHELSKINKKWKNISSFSDSVGSSRNMFLNYTSLSRNERYIILSHSINESPWRITEHGKKKINSSPLMIDIVTGKIIPLKFKSNELNEVLNSSFRTHFKGMVHLSDKNCLLFITNNLRFEKIIMPLSSMICNYSDNKMVDFEVLSEHDKILGDSRIKYICLNRFMKNDKSDYYGPITLHITIPRINNDGIWEDEVKVISTNNILSIHYLESLDDFESSGKDRLIVALSSKYAFLWIKNTNVIYYIELRSNAIHKSIEKNKDSILNENWKSIIFKQAPSALSCGINCLIVRFDKEDLSFLKIFDINQKTKLLTTFQLNINYKNYSLYKINAEQFDILDDINNNELNIVILYKTFGNDFYIKYLQYTTNNDDKAIYQPNIIEREFITDLKFLCYHNRCLVFVDDKESSVSVYNIVLDEWRECKYTQKISQTIFELCKIIK